MTTEVLRNMLYAGSPTLTDLGYVVMDEVHYLADRFRGAVWEEVIIHLPESVRLVSLSATVSNAEEFGDWLSTGARRHRRSIVARAAGRCRCGSTCWSAAGMFDLFADERGTDPADGLSGSATVNPELHADRARRLGDAAGSGRRRSPRRQAPPDGPGGAAAPGSRAAPT